MRLDGTRFGNIEFDDDAAIEINPPLVGFPDETRFVLLRPREGRRVAWLQSLTTPALAFPVVDGTRIRTGYPRPSVARLAEEAGLGTDVALLVIVATRPGETTMVANLLAPVVVDVGTRRGAQVVLDPRRYSAAAPLPESALSDSNSQLGVRARYISVCAKRKTRREPRESMIGTLTTGPSDAANRPSFISFKNTPVIMNDVQDLGLDWEDPVNDCHRPAS